MRIYNTASKKIEEIKILNPPIATVYTCGPTVYDYAHIGHWFTYIRADLLIRTLKANNFEPKWVLNITDVGHLTSDADEGEDKLAKKAKKEGKDAWHIAEYFTKDFIDGMNALNITKPNFMPKATDHIEEQIKLIEVLEKNGYTYKISDGIYFDTSKFKDYDKFAGLDLDEQQAGTRIGYNPDKKNHSDFALWKFSPELEKRDMEWDSPWGKGFPGWHIECSAMSMKYLGETLDFHTGGIDHVPVHHTNEVAQSYCATGKKLANYWLHTNHVLINDEKLSKSLGNGITLDDVLEQGYSLEAFRLHVLESHYRSQSKFSWDSLEAAKNRLKDLQALAVLRFQAQKTVNDSATFSLREISLQIIDLLSNDLNTPSVMALLSRISTDLQTVLIEEDMVDHFEAMIKSIDDLLGFRLFELKDINNEQKSLISNRENARDNKDFASADKIRQQLESQGIGLRDTSYGSIWYYL